MLATPMLKDALAPSIICPNCGTPSSDSSSLRIAELEAQVRILTDKASSAGASSPIPTPLTRKHRTLTVAQRTNSPTTKTNCNRSKHPPPPPAARRHQPRNPKAPRASPSSARAARRPTSSRLRRTPSLLPRRAKRSCRRGWRRRRGCAPTPSPRSAR